jgi:hypothetical protein
MVCQLWRQGGCILFLFCLLFFSFQHNLDNFSLSCVVLSSQPTGLNRKGCSILRVGDDGSWYTCPAGDGGKEDGCAQDGRESPREAYFNC